MYRLLRAVLQFNESGTGVAISIFNRLAPGQKEVCELPLIPSSRKVSCLTCGLHSKTPLRRDVKEEWAKELVLQQAELFSTETV